MMLKQFLTIFLRVQPDEPDKTNVRFKIGEAVVSVRNIEYDVENNMWTVQLSKMDG